MKKLLLLTMCVCGLSSSFAQTSNLSTTKSMTYLSAYGGTHSVKPYVRKDGTFVQGHRAGNPGSGVHCHDNICY